MKHALDDIAAWLAGELDDDRARRVAAHLESCPDCAREVRQQRRLLEVLAEAREVPSARSDPWPQIRRQTLEDSGASPFAWLRGQGKLGQKVLAGTALAAGLFLAVLLPAPPVVSDQVEWTTSGDTEFELAEASWLGVDTGSGLDQVWLAAGFVATEEE